MAWRRLQVAVALALAVAVTAATLSSAQQQAAAFPALPSCPPAPLSLSPCIGYVFGVGSATLTACCSQLRSFLRAQAPCLCAASKLAPSPVGLLLGQAQTIIPNVCDLPNPCDDAAAGDGEGSGPAAASTPSVAGTSPPSSETTTPAATTPATETSSGTPAADPDASGAPPQPAEDSPAAATAPAGAGSKLPQLLHAAGATSSRGMAAGTVLVTVFLASVATILYNVAKLAPEIEGW
ncbi:non-specific lipid-transfer protein-like protein [Panicum miliaceum]|uniref:Non-specific lipid-transfer protein-like protein n=1 Tax=Panicum miliaceum TaxID=4540 RepID=A0A3L6TNX3_PANMI|nr:non-specific lipid-transfer protein-like protein [Panicum miliaceum]